MRIAIVYSASHEYYVFQIREKLKSYLTSRGVKDIIEYEAPGCNEIPYIASNLTKKFFCHGIICVGVIFGSQAERLQSIIANGIMSAQIFTGIPMTNLILYGMYNFNLEEHINGSKCTFEYEVKCLLTLINYSQK